MLSRLTAAVCSARLVHPHVLQAAGTTCISKHTQQIPMSAMAGGPRLVAQSFGGNTLVRGVGQVSLEQILEQQGPRSEFMLVAERRVCTASPSGTGQQHPTAVLLRWLDLPALQQLHFRREEKEQLLLRTDDGGVPIPIYLLGRDAAGSYKLAADVSKVPQPTLGKLQLGFRELRTLMPAMGREELAIAGHAVALSQWHQAHLFCPRCGSSTVPSEGGGRRQCTTHEEHRMYPRTDPVVIMLVESPDGQQALLGRSKKIKLPLYTCLAGFVDQGESIEEAVAREVREESGVEVTHVHLLGSQPWPIGRGGSCELMIGCIARARGKELVVDYNEMEDVRWVDQADVAAAVAAADSPANPYAGGKGVAGEGEGAPPFWMPPSVAIAHHLIKAWAEHGGNWFGQPGSQQHATPSSL